jgi:hypothetical protein
MATTPAFARIKHTGETLAQGMANLKFLKVGGQMPEDVLSGLFVNLEGIERLSLVNLHESPGQNDRADAVELPPDARKQYEECKANAERYKERAEVYKTKINIAEEQRKRKLAKLTNLNS